MPTGINIERHVWWEAYYAERQPWLNPGERWRKAWVSVAWAEPLLGLPGAERLYR